MKKLLLMLSTALMLTFTGCMQFDDTRIWDAIDELEDLYDELDGRLEDLEEACEKMNTNIEAMQTIISALQSHDTIKSIAPIKQGDKVVGYTITFTNSEPITIYHGEDGKDGADGEDGKDGANGSDGYTPTIGVAKDADENYYWTLDGEWLLDAEGNKIKANGNDGKDGENGADGKDGITPQLEIRDGYWYISYDNGQSWVELGKATGEDGKDGANGADGADGEDGKDGENGKDGADGDSLFESVTWDEEYAYFTLSDGTVITIPLSREAVNEPIEIIAKYYWAEYEGSWNDIHAYEIALTDTYNILEEKYDNEESNCNFYNIAIYTNEEPVTGVLPNGTYVLSTTYEAGTLSGVEGGECYIIRNGEWKEVYATDAVLVISDNKIDGTFTLDNGEVHHVVYEGSLVIGEEGGDLPPTNEIWYTSTDGEVVTPNATDVFGANIVSNTYENGKGVITFDGVVTTIGYEAFYDCWSLASVTIPDSVTSIGQDAFMYCESLVSINIPDSVTSIGYYAFFYCKSLTSVTIPESVTEIGSSAFSRCKSLTSVTIPNSVTSIGSSAFAGCTSLKSFYGKYASNDGRCLIIDGVLNSFAPAGLTEYTIPDSVTSIGRAAFFYCTSLTSVTIPDSVTSIGNEAFRFCTSLTSITIPDSVTSIGDYAFAGCESLASVTIPDSVTSIGEDTFEDCTSLTSITIPNGVTSIGEETFRNCISLTSITIPNSVTSIGYMAFYECTSLTSITIPDSVSSIGDYAFAYCSSLTSITIPDSVTSIGGSAFYECSSLTSVTIGNGVTSIGRYAFYECTSLTSVYCKAVTPPAGGSGMFDRNASERKIYVPTESVDAYKAADYWSDYADYIEPYNFGGGEGNAGVKEVAAVSLVGMYEVGDNFYVIFGYVSSGEDAGYDVPMNSWNYGFNIISDTEPVNDEIPLGTYTYVDYEKLVSGEEELKAGIFIIGPDWGLWCAYVDANGEMQEYKYTEGTIVVSEGKIELTVTLDNGEVHHVVYEGSLQTLGGAA